MRILIIGGTSFAGRHMAERAVAEGHTVTLFNRARTNPGAIAGAAHIRGDRSEGPAGLAGLSAGEWDATIDVCAYVPHAVRDLLGVLGERSGTYVFISTISVYPENLPGRFTEESPVVGPSYSGTLTMAEYGALKVGCELTAGELVPDRLCIVRPGYIVGPYDPSGRFTYWVERVARANGARMLGPEPDQPLQVIDGRDLAAFTIGLVEARTRGVFNATAPDPALRFDEALRQIADGAGVGEPQVVWAGPRPDLPLTDGRESWGLLDADLARARAAGLTWRPLADTTRDLLDWVGAAREAGTYADAGQTISPEAEDELLGSAR